MCLVLWCDIHVKTMFGSSLLPFVMYFHFRWCSCRLTVIRRVSLVEQELPTLPEHMSSLPVFSGVPVSRSLVFCEVFGRSFFVHLYFWNSLENHKIWPSKRLCFWFWNVEIDINIYRFCRNISISSIIIILTSPRERYIFAVSFSCLYVGLNILVVWPFNE